jgi:hypothetical protein
LRMKLQRQWRPIDTWEEIGANMWGEVQDRAGMLQKAIEFTGDHKRYGSYMVRVVNEWPNSCANALTDPALNRRAWVGHAACAMALGCPEDITRHAWSYLSNEQRILANGEAERAIQSWEKRLREGLGVREHVAQAMLFE